MEIYLEDYHPIKKFLYKAASWGLYPTILSAIGFAFIGSPSNIQVLIRRSIPLELREHMLMVMNYEGWLITLFCITVFCAVWGGAGSQATVRLVTRKHKDVVSENDQLKEESNSKSINCYKVFSNYLYSYAQRFDLGAEERVSLYKLDMDMFSCIGRYSENELFKSKPSRLYPKDQGCIAKAWETGTFQDTSAPDPEDSLEAWKQHNIDKFNFTVEQIERIRMRSRAFYGLRLRNAENVTVAVLVFESLKTNGLPFGKLQRFFKPHEVKNLVNLIESLEQHIPSLEDARSEGF
ncbi:hypothetical protein [Pseudoalteromonas lipolytica]|uniref:hypothetical protein n=1 Tax=Pseudoalteromonas lipolytica TaxID=570156 RepID=UPI0008245CE7|nr:hypothetical protein [Pseudoalteromonas lipolytica]